ncbi:MAG: hypothetical protein NZ773_15830 [Dehalococcoidia bacterium]|nr:hypothetical protein [Dehalococcoidia bacterium]
MPSLALFHGVARRLEVNVIARRILGQEDIEAFAAGAAIGRQFLAQRSADASRFVAAWRDAITRINEYREFRARVLQQRNVPSEIAEHVPAPLFRMASDLEARDFQVIQDFLNFARREGNIGYSVDVLQMIRLL